jgi:hypothetical protein
MVISFFGRELKRQESCFSDIGEITFDFGASVLVNHFDEDFAILDFDGVDTNIILAGNTDWLAGFDIEAALVQGTLYETVLDDEALGKAGGTMTALILRRIKRPVNSVETDQIRIAAYL